MGPVVRFSNQRNRRRPAAAEKKRADRHTGRIVPVGIEGWNLFGSDRKPRIRMSSRLSARRAPLITLPVDQILRRLFREAFPPYVAVERHGDVREYRVAMECGEAVRI